MIASAIGGCRADPYTAWYDLPYMYPDIIPSAEARSRLPSIIEELVARPERTYEVGRQRRREVVLLAASRFDEFAERERALSDVAWAAFAQDRIENPTSDPVSWEEAQRRRSQAG
jgi:hypothetical protein